MDKRIQLETLSITKWKIMDKFAYKIERIAAILAVAIVLSVLIWRYLI